MIWFTFESAPAVDGWYASAPFASNVGICPWNAPPEPTVRPQLANTAWYKCSGREKNMHRRTFLLGLLGMTTAAAAVIGASADPAAAAQPAGAAGLPESELDGVRTEWAQNQGGLGMRRFPSRERRRVRRHRRRHEMRMRRRAHRARRMRRW